ncbi:MAG TPA: hypothetical protein VFL95_05540 [Gemmatimonadales bacterium]|nr:hypothetical protein [Gemmatimonadales bacterium]
MRIRIHRLAAVCRTLALLGAVTPVRALPAQTPCPAEARGQSGAASDSGWTAYRQDSLALAHDHFARALALCPGNADARAGLAYVALRQHRPAVADSLFRNALAHDSSRADLWTGRALAALRLGRADSAKALARHALALDPNAADARALLDRLNPDWNRAPLTPPVRPDSLQLVSRTEGSRFEVRTADGWQPFYIKGVNLGVALPGRFPSQFPTDSALYAGWLDTLATMHANTLRVYTILPPEFYRALRGWNLQHPDAQLWLLHGVWTELPPNDDFDDSAWVGEFRAEMRRVVDLIHGAAEIAPRPGHASGRYDADVSRWTLGYIIGREWEPYAVKAYDASHPGTGSYRGRYLAADSATALDRWMATQCDYLLSYEVDRYNALRPIAYTNWPTLDPLHHPSESTVAEEREWRRRVGRPFEAPRLEYENDAVSLDAELVHSTAANPAGWFAAYHAYPYYPDFMINDTAYQHASSSEGRSNYFGYLRDLIAHHHGMPVVIAEYGVPSSRGIAHLQPQGWNHGGHDEREMARIDARLTREIREAGAAGGVIFSWLDEWFKKNWIVIDFEIPPENTRLWHNMMDAEQNYGIMGEYAGRVGEAPVLGGVRGSWDGGRGTWDGGRGTGVVGRGSWDRGRGGARSRHSRESGNPVVVGYDESYVYLATEIGKAGRAFPWDSLGVQIAIDTYRPLVGQHRLPHTKVESEIGFEFLADLAAPDSGSLRILPEYNPYASLRDSVTGDDYGRFYHRPVTILNRDDGRFDSMFVITNRARFARDGRFFPASGYDRGKLRYGTEDSTSLADWYYDEGAGLLELRLPWNLLNVTDPSSRTLLFEREAGGEFGTVSAEGFHFGVITYRKSDGTVVAAAPALRGGEWRASDFAAWNWKEWNTPNSHARLKPVYDSLRTLWGSTP